MELRMDAHLAENYHNTSQKIRVITEKWVGQNVYCPCCGNKQLSRFENNRPVADFFCAFCHEEYELKSKAGTIGRMVNDGTYDKMIARITTSNNPNFFFMNYNRANLKICDLFFVPKYFFVPEIIVKRKPLAETARRAGWTGCNILLSEVPREGKIFLIKNETLLPVEDVLKKVKKTNFISDYKLGERGWMLDILNCIQAISSKDFSIEDMYCFEEKLSKKYPNNHHIKEKIRQQLQVLRDRGVLEFKGKGKYQKI